MKFKVTKIAAAVAAGVGVSVAVSTPRTRISCCFLCSGQPDGDDDSDGSQQDRVGFFFASSDELHYHYYHVKGTKADDLSATCDEINFGQNTSPNDIVTFDVGGFYGDKLGVLFEDNVDDENAKYCALIPRRTFRA